MHLAETVSVRISLIAKAITIVIFILICFSSMSMSGDAMGTVNDGGADIDADRSRLSLKTVVIDAGHGGKDAGCISKDKKTYEKNLTLSLAKLLGGKISAAYPDVKVIYTRTTDKYVDLSERAEIANRNNADLFISIHINSFSSASPHGYSTHVLGQSRDKNRDLFSYHMDVCRRENSVILMEDDYTTKYQGFDPDNPESFIFFNLMQNAFYEQSLLFAADVDREMGRSPISYSRGVWQDPFLVLWKTKMPAVLIEAGFISNIADLKILRSASGQNSIAEKLFDAFKSFKIKYDGSVNYYGESLLSTPTSSTTPTSSSSESKGSSSSSTITSGKQKIFYGVQIFALGKKLSSGDPIFKGYDVVSIESGSVIKYIIPANSREEAFKLHSKIRNKFTGSFVVKVDGNAITRQKK